MSSTEQEKKEQMKKEMKGLEAYGIDQDNLKMLQEFVKLVKNDPTVLNNSNLEFFKNWLENDLGANIPKSESTHPEPSEEDNSHRKFFQKSSNAGEGDAWKEEKMEEESEEESDFEVDMEGVIPEDTDPPQEMGDPSKEVTEAEEEEANNMKMLGIDALNGGDVEGAITHFTSGIKLDCTKTLLFVKRATAYLRLPKAKPNAAIRDAQKALSINPDSATSHKVLGKSQRLLGKWEEACHHLEEAQKIDFDDNVVEILKDIKPKANRIREHRVEKERKTKEREVGEKLKKAERIRKAQEQARKEQEERDRENLAGAFNFAEGMQGPGGFNFAEGMQGSGMFEEAKSESEDDDEDKDGPKITEVEDDLD